MEHQSVHKIQLVPQISALVVQLRASLLEDLTHVQCLTMIPSSVGVTITVVSSGPMTLSRVSLQQRFTFQPLMDRTLVPCQGLLVPQSLLFISCNMLASFKKILCVGDFG